MVGGEGTASPQMRPRESWPQDQLPPGAVHPDGPAGPDDDSVGHRVPPHLERDILGLYLSAPLPGPPAARGRAGRMARAYAAPDSGRGRGRAPRETGGGPGLPRDPTAPLGRRGRPPRPA